MGREIQEVHGVENALVGAGRDDFLVATERGPFHWMMAAKSAAD